MYDNPYYDTADQLGIDLIPYPAIGLLVPTVRAEDRAAMVQQAQVALELLRTSYDSLTHSNAGPLVTETEKVLDYADELVGDQSRIILEALHLFGGRYNKVTLGLLPEFTPPEQAELERELLSLMRNTLNLETEAERQDRRNCGSLTHEEWDEERESRALYRALDAEAAADAYRECAALGYY